MFSFHVFPPMHPPTDSFFEGVLRPATLESGVRQTSVGTSDIYLKTAHMGTNRVAKCKLCLFY